MFIEREFQKIPPRSSGAKWKPDLLTIAGTLRSAGARVVLITGFYKHSAPLEPEHYLVAAWAALGSLLVVLPS